MTVCVAAKTTGGVIFAASDRMMTAGDVQFEAGAQKVTAFTNSIAVLTAGDASLNAEILARMRRELQDYLSHSRDVLLPVSEAATWYVRAFARIKSQRAEARLLLPLGHDRDTLLGGGSGLPIEFIKSLAEDMQAFPMPVVEAIVTGIDDTGAHIFAVCQDEIRCEDTLGFAAIGSGAGHAEGHFMSWPKLLRWFEDEGQTLLMTYLAKKRAEVAPGVGGDTDLITIGPEPFTLNSVLSEAIDELQRCYSDLDKLEIQASLTAALRMKDFSERLAESRAEKDDGTEQEEISK
ncbi:hypothetical protein [Phenylobacterium sp.]|uniref:hypothetical protein n=1 Tax=Phenylobacterium sp. TaxID=1871053 RepID=UPI003BA9D80A